MAGTTVKFPVFLCDDKMLGYIDGRPGKCGDSLLPLARELCARKLKISEEEVTLDSVHLQSGPVTRDTAFEMPVSQLHSQQAKIYMQAPHTEPAFITALKDEVHSLKQDLTEYMERTAKLESLQQRMHKVALRSLLDKSRHVLAGGELPADQRNTWNTRIQDGNVSAPAGVTAPAVNLTKFGLGTEQQEGNAAAHEFTTAAIAEAVVAQPAKKRILYGQLFSMCFQQSADDVVMDLLPSDDE